MPAHTLVRGDLKTWPSVQVLLQPIMLLTGSMSDTPNKIEPIQEKLDDKIKKLNSSRVYKKVTPKGDLSWYIKWASSVTLIIAMMFTAVDMFPINMWIANIGFIGWLVVGMLWHDRSLIVLNSVSLAIYSLGILNHYYGY